eukprot:765525-Hanusia_phi.AAC.2
MVQRLNRDVTVTVTQKGSRRAAAGTGHRGRGSGRDGGTVRYVVPGQSETSRRTAPPGRARDCRRCAATVRRGPGPGPGRRSSQSQAFRSWQTGRATWPGSPWPCIARLSNFAGSPGRARKIPGRSRPAAEYRTVRSLRVESDPDGSEPHFQVCLSKIASTTQ